MTGGGRGADDADRAVESDTEDLYERAPCAYLSTLPDGTIVRANQTFFDWFGSSREELLREAALSVASHRRLAHVLRDALCAVAADSGLCPRDLARGPPARRRRPAGGGERQAVSAPGRHALSEPCGAVRLDRPAHATSRSCCRRASAPRMRYASSPTVDRQKTEFMAMLAHELRNPLAPIRNALEVLRQDDRLVKQTTAHHAASGRTDGPVGRRPVRHQPHRPGQAGAAPGPRGSGLGHPPRGGGECTAVRGCRGFVHRRAAVSRASTSRRMQGVWPRSSATF